MKTFKRLLIFLLLAAIVGAIVIAVVKNGGHTVAADIHLNEVMAKNSVAPDSEGKYYDWIELYNASASIADAGGFGLSDSLIGGVKFVIPHGTSIPANGFLVIYCSGDTTKGALHTGFKLASTDEVILYNANGKVIDSIQLRAVSTDCSLGKEPDGTNWAEMQPSPGFANTSEGIAAYKAKQDTNKNNSQPSDTAKPTPGDVVINEYMPSNKSTIATATGYYEDWVELYNKTDKEVKLTGYQLSDDPSKPDKYTFPETAVIPAHGYILVFLTTATEVVPAEGELIAPFGLSAYEESIVLTNADGVLINSDTYSRAKADVSFARTPDGTGDFKSCTKPTPGYPNTSEGFAAFAAAVAHPTFGVYFSELLASNDKFLPYTDEATGEKAYCDWVEIYNSTSSDFNLSGYCLSDSAKNPAKWEFPKDTVIGSGKYMVVLLNGVGTKGTYYQANFCLSSEGENVFLFSPEGKLLDKIGSVTYIKDISLGRNAEGDILYFDTPSPAAQNSGKTYKGILTAPSFGTTPGIYTESVNVDIASDDGATIYYTTDCTMPTTSSSVYKGAVNISKNTVVRAMAYRDDYYCAFASTSGTYLFTTDGASHNLPVLALTTDPDNLWNKTDGIYCYGTKWETVGRTTDTWPYWQTPANFWQDKEVPASFELFGDDNMQTFQQNIGISISGAFGRGREQKGIAVMARDEYGKNRMSYQFFPDMECSEYKSLLLRCGAQDQANGKYRDELSIAVLKNTDLNVNFLYQDYKPYVLYLNGKYWGVYFLREKRNRFFVSQHENVDADNVTLVKSETRAQYGTTKEWKALMDYVRSHDLTVDANYNYINERIDLDSFMDYMICESYVGNSDYWNIQMCKPGDGKWKFIYYDFCWGWDYIQHNTLYMRRQHAQPCSDFFNALLKRNDWRDRFIRRFAEIMDTVFEPEHVTQCIDSLYAAVSPEIARERSIFNSSSSPYFDYVDPHNVSTVTKFEDATAYMRKFANERRAVVVSQIKSEFGLTDAYIKEVFGE